RLHPHSFPTRRSSDLVLPSLGRLGIAILLCVALGLVLGAFIGQFRPLREFLEPVLEFFRAIPPPVLIPIVTLLLGITDQMKITRSEEHTSELQSRENL